MHYPRRGDVQWQLPLSTHVFSTARVHVFSRNLAGAPRGPSSFRLRQIGQGFYGPLRPRGVRTVSVILTPARRANDEAIPQGGIALRYSYICASNPSSAY